MGLIAASNLFAYKSLALVKIKCLNYAPYTWKYSVFLQMLYGFVFCNSEICCAFGIYTTFPRVLVNVEGVYPIENLHNSLAIEMDNMPDPLISLEFSVKLCSLLHDVA